MNFTYDFSSSRVLVLGDFLIDHYVEGVVERISPEAPVPILKQIEEFYKPGGAANVAVNCRALGATVHLISVVGFFSDEHFYDKMLKKYDLDGFNLIHDTTKEAIVKTRFTSNGHHILRLDKEKITPLSSAIKELVLKRVKALIQNIDVIVFSDYAKGFFDPTLIQQIVHMANSNEVKVLVDPKGGNFSKYQGCFLVKPNLKEAIKAATAEEHDNLTHIAKVLLDQSKSRYILITRSSDGMSLFDSSLQEVHFPALKKEVVDVVGAGDTAISLVAVALASGHTIEEAVGISNIGASIVVSKKGCATVTVEELIQSIQAQPSCV
jgi:D-beta-D-heptose 7-phosphate kinase/D-beta-D-heptose 1-phosphate adenosyltransferase